MKKAEKAKSSKSMKDLPRKTVNPKKAKSVKGGTGFTYGGVQVEYKPQRSDGVVPKP